MNYGELQTHFTNILGRRDLTASLRDSFISMGISRVQRELRAPMMEKAVQVTIGADYDGLSIPSDYISLVALTVVDEETKLQRVDLETAQQRAVNQGIPKVFARQGGRWILGPAPTENTVIRIDYHAEFGALSTSTDETTLTIVAPDLVTYAALSYAADYFLDKRYERFEDRYVTILNQVQGQADYDELSDSIMSPCQPIEDERI